MEQLMLEPVEYDETIETLTVESLRTLSNACLTGLDNVLRHIVLETACESEQRARPSTVVPSILHSTSCLARAAMTDGDNLTTALSQVQHLLDTHLWLISSHTDLCRTLLQLVYTIRRTDAGHRTDPIAISPHATLQHVRTEIRHALASLPSHLMFAQKSVEAEFYQRVEALHRALSNAEHDDEHPPAYQELSFQVKEEKPPQYQEEQPYSELDLVFRAIDRLSHVTPRFNNQRVERQLRISHQPAPKMLCNSIAQIPRPSRFKLSKKSASDQVDRRSLYEMTDLLVKSLHRPCFNKQRYHLTADKERDLFMNGLFNKVDRLEGRRLSNQDAEQPTPRHDELDQILNHICRAKRTQFDNQRATFTVHSS
ncbi:hypothetical protein BJV82DRAFT_611004 [Fennellomyces sp. T-0311]|nr:hypothetical protein BJV82DRAFT_611004 [Fennellomyces sp. T-0311]